MRAADYVFETLSRAILMGELTPGSVLATQRALSQQFGVSPLVVRQATHRLEELGLVRVRQGSTTVVLDPNDAADLRLTQLQLELATPGDRLSLAAREMQSLSTLPLLILAERRIQEDELDELEALVESMPEPCGPRDQLAFRRQFWGIISRATRNPILEHQIRWWARVMQEMESRGPTGVEATGAQLAPRSVYRGLLRALRRKRGTVDYWLKVIEPLFDWSEQQPNHPVHGDRAPLPKRARVAQ
jgi:GntR family transcriptional repressor for pyruvate dehydrogenase complex